MCAVIIQTLALFANFDLDILVNFCCERQFAPMQSLLVAVFA